MSLIYPEPRFNSRLRGVADLSGGLRVRCKSRLSHRLANHLDQLVTRLPTLRPDQNGNAQGGLELLIDDRDTSHPQQGYGLRIEPGGIALCAGGEEGLFHGLMTLAQLLRPGQSVIQARRIRDYPDLLQRGVMLDISRCKVPTMATLYTLIDQLAALKINQLQLYIEHTFAFTDHRQVWQDASPLTAGDIRALDAYCTDRYIDLVPNLNSFGHFERWLRHPEYHQYAECPAGFEHPLGGHRTHGSTLKPNNRSLQLLDELYGEYLPNFSGSFFNVGADEPWELGQGWSHRKVADVGKHRVYLDFLNKLDSLTRRHGRQMMFWGDIALERPDLLASVPSQSTALIWGYEAHHPFRRQCEFMNRAGRDYYVCPGTSSWNSLTGRSNNARQNLLNATRNAVNFGASGLLITDWGDQGHHQYLPISYPGLLFGACFSWCLKSNRSIDPASGVSHQFMGLDDPEPGQILWDLGQVTSLLDTSLRNATPFNQLLFWSLDGHPDYMQQVTVKQVEAALEEFDNLQARTRATLANHPDLDLWSAEINNAIFMARHGLQRYLLYIGRDQDKAKARRQLEAIIPAHERLWLARNRLGGLYESSTRLRSSLDPLM